MGPLKFHPLLKRLRWGGRRLGDVLGKPIGAEADYAESWELCDHGDDQTLVADGALAGWSLGRLVRERPVELLGRHAGARQFPLLIKFLDAHDRLSVQVHPDDEQASRLDAGDRGKTEAWVILAADAGSCLFAGLKRETTAGALRRALQQGSVETCLNRIEVAAGDCLFIPAGTVHAIGEGILLAEVQQASDVTFRLFDWNRVGGDGRPRTLHVDESLACIDFARGPVGVVQPVARHQDDGLLESLVACPFFSIRRHTISRPLAIADDGRCRILIGLGGAADCTGGGERQSLRVGQTVLIPAAAMPAQVVPAPTAIILEVDWP